MTDADDMKLVREFAARNSEAAFAEVVRRHINLVYFVALRVTGNSGHAEDVAQAVFIVLARKAVGLPTRTVLTGWLYETTRFTASRLLRAQIRRQVREREAFTQTILDEPGENNLWSQLAPHLEAAMSRLSERDRTLLVLRFYESKTSAETAALLGIREEAAHKRTARALEKLRNCFMKRGITSTSAVIAESISANSMHSSPAALAKTVTVMALAKGATAGGSVLALAEAASKAMVWAKIKFAGGLGAAVLLAGSVISVALTDKKPEQPDPVAMLKEVATAREKIKSAEMEFLLTSRCWIAGVHMDYLLTNNFLLKVALDGKKLRFEQIRRATVITPTPADWANSNRMAEIDRMDPTTLARFGLVSYPEEHGRTIHDGKVIMAFGMWPYATIQNSNTEVDTFLFDPRTFGLYDFTVQGATVAGYLEFRNPKLVSLVGKEDVNGIPAWHISVQAATNWPIEFWIDVAHPTHVIKMAEPNRPGIAWSKYDPQNPNDPLPIEVNVVAYRGYEGKSTNNMDETHMIRLDSRYNVPIEPKAFTLAALGMPVGTPINDVQTHRRITARIFQKVCRATRRRARNPRSAHCKTIWHLWRRPRRTAASWTNAKLFCAVQNS